MEPLLAISPIDGRYRDKVLPLVRFFSEKALIEHRLIVITEGLIAFSEDEIIPLRHFTPEETAYLRSLQRLKLRDAKIIKAIETEGYGQFARTNHDVKACEFYVRMKLAKTSLADVLEWIRFGFTSEDDNNLAYAMMLSGAIHTILLPELEKLHGYLRQFAENYADLPMLARTHGQAASPTTFGKEFRVFADRLARQLRQLREYEIMAKFNSASGNYNALRTAVPNVDWIGFSLRFVRALGDRKGGPGFEVNLITTQIEPHDTYAELFDILKRAASILVDFSRDVWQYISDDWIVQVPVKGERGSSIMPHKVNPIDWENGEGNFGVGYALLAFFAEKLTKSRLQRDLSDSTVERNFGVAFGHYLIGILSLLRGFDKIAVNKTKITKALRKNPKVITEAYQTILRRINFPDAYNVLAELSRGQDLTLDNLQDFVRSLDIPSSVQDEMIAIVPTSYIGLASRLAML